MIETHHYPCKLENEVIVAGFKEDVNLSAWVYPKMSDGHLITRLEVIFTFENNNSLLEFFEDTGNSLNDCVQNNIENFMKSSFHVLLDAFNDTNKYSDVEEWDINGRQFTAYLGDYIVKQNEPAQLTYIPDNILELIKDYLYQLDWPEKYFFVCFFYIFDGQNERLECSVNNIRIEFVEETFLKQLDWQKTDSAYSVRYFMVLKRMD